MKHLVLFSLVLTLAACTPTHPTHPSTGANETSPAARPAVYPDPADKVVLTEAQWKVKLTADQFDILRAAGTERPFSSPLNEEKRDGDFVCAACDNLLFQSQHKFDSGTGWPSYDQPAPGSVKEIKENDFHQRTEVRCARCDGHLGHVFTDGPRDTTGLRYCINGDALVFYETSPQPPQPPEAPQPPQPPQPPED